LFHPKQTTKKYEHKANLHEGNNANEFNQPSLLLGNNKASHSTHFDATTGGELAHLQYNPNDFLLQFALMLRVSEKGRGYVP